MAPAILSGMDTTVVTALLLGLLVGALVGAGLVRAAAAPHRARLEGERDAVAARLRAREAQDQQDGELARAVAPLGDTLGRVEARLRELEVARVDAYARLTEQVSSSRETGEALRAQTGALVTALRAPQARGAWGELQLRRVVEIAGMTERCDFDEQVTVKVDGVAQRPDLVVRLAGGKSIVVDAKVPLAAYLTAAETTDDAVREERLRAHARHLRAHVDALAAKRYWEAFANAPELVVLFVPGESFLGPALTADPALLEDAMRRRVVIATPTTLVAMLRTVAYAWQQDALADNAREVFELGTALHRRLGAMGAHLDKLGKSLTGSVAAYNATVGSLETSVLRQARRLRDLEVTDLDLAAPEPVTAAVRPLTDEALLRAADLPRSVPDDVDPGPLRQVRSADSA